MREERQRFFTGVFLGAGEAGRKRPHIRILRVRRQKKRPAQVFVVLAQVLVVLAQVLVVLAKVVSGVTIIQDGRSFK